MALKPWYKVMTPREDLRDGRPLDASELAVHLGVIRRLSGIKVETSAICRTPWGEIAFQLGGKEGFAVVAQHDAERTAPSTEVIRQFLPKDKPALSGTFSSRRRSHDLKTEGRTTMSKRILLSVACLLLFAGIALAAGEPVSAPPALLSAETGPACQADPAAALTQLGFQPVYRGHDPATCGRCLSCKSSTACAGRLLGDLCSNDGSTCQAFDGCALYNCCRCSNLGTGARTSK